MIQSEILQDAEPVGAAFQREPQLDQSWLAEEAERDVNRLNGEGVIYSGYHVDLDAPGVRRPRTTGGLA